MKKLKKLQLDKEIIARLEEPAMHGIRGGTGLTEFQEDRSGNTACSTEGNCTQGTA